MAHKDMREAEGVVLTRCHNHFRVKLDSGEDVLAILSGKLRRCIIRVVQGDVVRLRMSPYDTARGIIYWRC